MKIAHEAPIDIFETVQQFTSYDYALVHMFEENVEYYNKFVQAKENGREIILDNSIFELGVSFDSDKYIKWINLLQPTWYIIPDVLEDTDATIAKFKEWEEKYSPLVNPNIKRIGVVQGKTYDDIVRCYKAIEPYVDKVAISFDYSMYEQNQAYKNKWYRYMYGRRALLAYLVDTDTINVNKPHHLLGCALPQEFTVYKELDYYWIDSVDTSNPVVHGINDIMYKDYGLTEKVTTKLIDYMFEKISSKQLSTILYNMGMFRAFCV